MRQFLHTAFVLLCCVFVFAAEEVHEPPEPKWGDRSLHHTVAGSARRIAHKLNQMYRALARLTRLMKKH